MPDTGAPYFIPYVEPTALVRDYPAADEAQADAIVAGLDAVVGLVAVKSALKTDAQSFTSVLGGNNVALTDLSIEHALADASHRLIISAFFGAAGSSSNVSNVGIAVSVGGGFIAVGDAEGNRTQVTAGGRVSSGTNGIVVTMPSVTFVHTPGDTTSRTYTVRAINIDGSTRTLFINRSQSDTNAQTRQRAVSSLVIQEVAV